MTKSLKEQRALMNQQREEAVRTKSWKKTSFVMNPSTPGFSEAFREAKRLYPEAKNLGYTGSNAEYHFFQEFGNPVPFLVAR